MRLYEEVQKTAEQINVWMAQQCVCVFLLQRIDKAKMPIRFSIFHF